MWPNLFIVGAAKGGTTSLWRYLDQHPDVHMSPVKEPHFFAPNETLVLRKVDDERAYLRLFADATTERWRGEASPSYLWDDSAPAAIKRVSADARIVIMLREPVSRAHSAYLHAVRAGECRSFLETVRAELAEPGPIPSLVVGRSLYADSVARYLHTFGERVHIVYFEEFISDVRREVRRVCEFLELDPSFVEGLEPEVHNPLSAPRNALSRGILGSPRARAVGRWLTPLAVQPRIEALMLKRVTKPEMEPAARELLVEVFQPDLERLRSLLDRPPPWLVNEHGRPS